MSTFEDIVIPPPHAVGPEKSVVSILLQYPEMIQEAPMLGADHFYQIAPRELFLLIQELAGSGKAIELVSLVQTLLDRGKLERLGGASAVYDIYSYATTPAHFQHHLAILNDKLARRLTVRVAAEMTRLAFEAESAEELIGATSTPISAIHDTLTATRPARSTRAVLHECLDRFGRLCAGEAKPAGIITSLFEFNRRFQGLHGKQTVVISGYPGGGKTTLAGQLALDAALDGHNTLICSLEMPEETMMNRALAYVARRPAKCITDPVGYAEEAYSTAPTKDMLMAVQAAANKISSSPFAIEDLIGASVHQIAACIRRAHRKSPLAVVVVDFVQRVRAVPEMRRESREQQLAHASNLLADLSKELGFCLLLPSQLNKEGAAKHAEAINEDSDLHLQIVQERAGPNPTFDHVGVAVVKDRHHGQDGWMLPIVLDGPMLRFIPKPPKP